MFSTVSFESEDTPVPINFVTSDPVSASMNDDVKTEEMMIAHDLQDQTKDEPLNSQNSEVIIDINEVGEGNSTLTFPDENVTKMLKDLNNSLDHELKETKKAVKRLFKETVPFYKKAKDVHAIWAPIYEFEQQESIRLEELHTDIQGSIGSFTIEPSENTSFITEPSGNIENQYP